MIPRDISRLCPPYTIPPEYILCYIRNRSSFNHTTVLLSFYVGLLLMPSSLVCEFLFLFWEISADWQIIKNCVILYLLRVRVLYTFLEISLFRLERGFFFYRSWTYWHCHVENVSGLIDATVIPIYIPLCSLQVLL